MANMSYCRFENTYNALQDCMEALDNEGGITGVEEDANDNEKLYVRRLVEFCREIADNYENELE